MDRVYLGGLGRIVGVEEKECDVFKDLDFVFAGGEELCGDG